MRYFWLFVAAALVWAWSLPPQTEGELQAQSADVASAPPRVTPEALLAWPQELLDWTDPEVADPLLLCELEAGGQAYLRQSVCAEQGRPGDEPDWARLVPESEPEA
jgi:hypothetical protein